VEKIEKTKTLTLTLWQNDFNYRASQKSEIYLPKTGSVLSTTSNLSDNISANAHCWLSPMMYSTNNP
jgi:hypothetical protein